MVDKHTYYISVQSGSINEDIGATPFEFQVRASEKEIEKLQELFEEQKLEENSVFQRAVIPAIPYHNDAENDQYDENLKRIYSMIYELGNSATKKHIESMNILQ
jgi:hypothetical protein